MATISIADNDARVQYTQAVTANTTQLTIDFPFFSLDDINVIVTSAAGVDTTLTRGTGTGTFAVTGTSVDDGFSGGHITLGDTYSDAATKYTIFRDVAISRTTDFPTSGPFNISSLNTELDKIFAIEQELETKLNRTMKLADSDTAATLSLPNLDTRKGTVLAFNTTTGLPEAGPEIGDVSTIVAITADISTLADIEDGTDATDAIQTVAGISSNVSTVAGISSNVSTVAGISSDVTAVAGDATDIGTVAGLATEIGLLGTADVVADMAILGTADVVSDLNTLATSAIVTDMDALADLTTELDALADITSNITTVAGISSNVTTVANNDSNVSTVAGVSSDVTTVAGQISPTNNIATVAGDSADIATVAGISSDVSTVSGISANTTTVAGISANVTTVAGISANVTTVAGDSADIATVAGISSDVSTVATNNANVTTVASNISGVNSFAERYRVGSADPTTSLDEGDLAYNSTDNALKFYNGSAWQSITAGIANISEDTTPELGGNLSVAGNKITSASNGDIDIEPNGTGNVLLGNFEFDVDQTVGAGQDNHVLTYDNATGHISLEAVPAGGISDLVDDTSPQLGGSLLANGNTIDMEGNELILDADGDTSITADTDDQIDFKTGGTDRMHIDSSGNVGIGDSTPDAKLDVYSTSGTTTDVGRFEAAVGSYTGTSLVAANTLGAAGTFNLFECITDSDADAGGPDTQFLVRGDGAVGIGTSSPTTTSGFENGKFIEVKNSGTASDATDNASIQIKSDSRHSLLSLMSNSAYSGYINFGDGNDNDIGQIRYNHADNSMRLTINANERARFSNDGRLNLDAEGGTNLVVDVRQGSAKHWVNIDIEGTNSTKDSYNHTSFTDNGVGNVTITINNDMNNANYSVSSISSRASDATPYAATSFLGNVFTSGTVKIQFAYANASTASFHDVPYSGTTIHGDLA